MSLKHHLLAPLIGNNPITLQILGICSALAVTTTLSTAVTMSVALTVVLCLSGGVISLMRNHIPPSIRLIIQITIVASIVIVIDQFMQAFMFEMSKKLSIFVGLIVTNCLVLGRAEAFAMRNPVLPSVMDGLGNGLGYSLVLLIVGALREFLGTGALMGVPLVATAAEGGWFQPLGLMQLAPSAFFILGLLVWLVRILRPEQVEQPEFRLRAPEDSRP
ncbi:NADH:ubiquinone reductase (Na(+)-transporting) subunit D [uncultured Hoeflea sp.]|uniref:NADH:ubiquinone reductase (Na(+)-transporting) subunit D n=1 Tax=uncultured Hoeflea sp. TaxID=538666 RepID=UPI0030D7CE4C|tara:strand:- start:1463 stop:2116 length:654 start_codon:yes stop_codon:yes gene_type:complete